MTDRGRVYEEATCPYCGHRDCYSIELEVDVKVKSTKMLEY